MMNTVFKLVNLFLEKNDWCGYCLVKLVNLHSFKYWQRHIFNGKIIVVGLAYYLYPQVFQSLI